MKLFYRHVGEGKPLLILHGLFGLSDNWMSFAKSIGRKYSVYIPDLRNHGQSPHSPVFDFPSLEDDLLELLEDNNLHNIDLLGHSLGGKASMLFALHQPGLVEKLVVVDISLRKYPPSMEHQQLIDAMLGVDFSVVKSRADIDHQLRHRVPSAKLRQFLLKNVYWRTRGTLDWRLNLASINQNLLSVFEEVDAGGIYEGPALFIRGGFSSYISDGDIGLMKRKFPRAEVTTIANASHWVHADAPGEFLRIVSEFLESD
jgi:esterase